MDLHAIYPPSEPCSCETCLSYCRRPGWWTVDEAGKAIEAGFAFRMMLEMSPDGKYAVLSPAFKGNEVNYALDAYSKQGCTFLKDERCELFGTGLQPLECRFCHHNSKIPGKECHEAVSREWNSNHAKRLIVKWGNITGFWQRQGFSMIEKPH
jgi:hypothetical protein